MGLVGPRQCCKTTLAKALMETVGRDATYLDLEDPSDLAKINDPELYLSQKMDSLVVIDEIQHRSDLFNLLRSNIDRRRTAGRFIILGSASPDLLRGSADSLAGRIAYVELSPFGWDEIKHLVSVNLYWLKGGFPDALLTKTEKETERWHKNYLQTYVQRDLGLLGLNISPTLAHRLMSMLSHLHGELMNFSNLGRSLGITSNTAKSYVNFLTESFIIRELQPFHTNTKKRLVKAPKFFYRDSGLLHYIHRVSELGELIGNPVAGKSWEGYVIEEVARKVGDKYDLFFYRTQRGAECDLVLCQNMVPKITVEIKLSNSPKVSRGYTESIHDLRAGQNFIVTPSTERFPLSEEVEAIGFEEFLGIL